MIRDINSCDFLIWKSKDEDISYCDATAVVWFLDASRNSVLSSCSSCSTVMCGFGTPMTRDMAIVTDLMVS